MTPEIEALFAKQDGVASSPQLLDLLPRRTMQRLIRGGDLVRVWPSIYSRGKPNDQILLSGLDLRCGVPVAACLGTAAAMFGFDTESVTDLHVLNPAKHLLRPEKGLVVHRRDGAPLVTVGGRTLTDPAWTAIEVARGLRRPRALATLDAALHTGTCNRDQLLLAAKKQARRRGIVVVRDLIALARAEAESPMESESRLAMIDGAIPMPELQYVIIDRDGRRWRVDFAWPAFRLVLEYDGFDWHRTHEQLTHDHQKLAALTELGWRVMQIVADDVRRHPEAMLRRLRQQLLGAAA